MLVKLFSSVCLLFLSYISLASAETKNATIYLKSKNISAIEDLNALSWSAWCKLQPNGYDCQDTGTVPKFYFDIKLGYCKAAEVGRCTKNKNRFDTVHECHTTCVDMGLVTLEVPLSPKVYCRFQPDFGACNDYHPRYYFDVTQRECKGFSYSGCGGNLNRFSSFQVCSAICMPLVDYVLQTALKT